MRLILGVGDQPETGGHIVPLLLSVTRTILGIHVAYIGGQAYCEACKCMGQIAKAGGPRRSYVCGHEIALDGDILQCKCPNPPRMIATTQKRSWVDDSATTRTAVGAPGIAAQTTHDEQFSLTDDDGQPMRGVRYRVRTGSNVVASGVTDTNGRTGRITTDGSQRLRLEVAH
ncbi:PAAR domain-containing protein [Paraburkholderia sp. GAS448]|uniref:PAAR domain-containing protein n=1 Tax=Paraburkholderia sp. GAS448 TaxID=3035136 RepID=UPI003D21E48E